MSRAYRKLLCHLIVLSICVLPTHTFYAISSLSKNDPYPMFSSLDPQSFLYDKERLDIKDPIYGQDKHSHVGLSLSPFGQNANIGRGIKGCEFLPETKTFQGEKLNSASSEDAVFTLGENCQTGCCPTDVITCLSGIPVELGDIAGRTNMIALLYGDLPQNQTLPPSLLEAQNALFPGVNTPINDTTKIDQTEQFASLSIPLKYRKRGVRFDLSANIAGGFGINIQTGVASICQTVGKIKDLTCNEADECPFVVPASTSPCSPAQVEKYLTQKFKIIADELEVDICDFNETSIEEIRFNAYWRQAYEMNFGRREWPHFLLMPFFVLSASVSPGHKMDPSKLFAVPFGNNGHNAVGFTTGISFDFVDTIEIACEVGATHFGHRTIPCMRMPNSLCQKTLFPFVANAQVSPGHNWHFGAKIAAYHFLDNLSAYFQYLMVEHEGDSIKPKNCDPAFKPTVLEKVSAWKTKIANIGFNYDISPNIAIGFLWQAPLSQRNTYRSTTVMASFNASF